MNDRPFIAGVLAIIALGLMLLGGAQLAGFPDASHHYTDFMRHEGEALILGSKGLELYREPYGKLLEDVGSPCPVHLGLFPERTAPYPPVGILVHWPWAYAERAGWLTPTAAHDGIVWMWTAVAMLACLAVTLLFRPLGPAAQLWALAFAVPLLVGMGINGFFDCGYLLFGALAALSIQRNRPTPLWLGLTGLMHFRAVAFAPLALKLTPRGRLMAAALCIPTLIAAVAVLGSLDTIPADNPVHYSHLKLPLLAFIAVTAAAAFWMTRETQPLVSLTLVLAATLLLFERSHGWWHAGTFLVPGFVLASLSNKSSRAWAVISLWTLLCGYLAFRHAWSPYWQWVPFGLSGHPT